MGNNMSWEENVRKVVPYVAGEQPKDTDVIKLNTNECPYPPAPGVEGKGAVRGQAAVISEYGCGRARCGDCRLL